MAVEAGSHRRDGGGVRQHADLHRVDLEIGEHRVDLRGPVAVNQTSMASLLYLLGIREDEVAEL